MVWQSCTADDMGMNLLPLAFRVFPVVNLIIHGLQAEQLNQLPDIAAEMMLLGMH